METKRYKKAVVPLFAASGLIILLGLAFLTYSIVNGTSFRVLNADLPGFVFGGVAVYLGIRYLLSTIKMARKIKGNRFSWKNFGGTAK